METLDYKAPERRQRSAWLRRYTIFVPIVGVGYGVIVACYVLLVLGYIDGPPMPKGLLVFAEIVGFPLIDFWGSGNMRELAWLALANAAIWGFCVVGFFHAMSVIGARIAGGTLNGDA